MQMNGGLSASETSKHTRLSYSMSSSGDASLLVQSHLTAPGDKSTSVQKRQQYNSPIGLYSAETLREMAMLQERAKSMGSSMPSGYVIMHRYSDASSQVWQPALFKKDCVTY